MLAMKSRVNEAHAQRKALLLYSTNTGKAKVLKHFDNIVKRLREAFAILDVRKTNSPEQGQDEAKRSCGVYDVLIVFGGDGTIRNIIDAIAEEENPPIIGYINGGTLNDFGVNFGIKGNHKKAVSIIEEGHIASFDVGKLNDTHFGYVCAVGAFADIPYITKRKYKKRIGSLAYYLQAAKEAFIPNQVEATLYINNKEIEVKTPFLLCMSGRHMAGFPVSKQSRTDDGLLELYVTKPGLFNGLLHYLFFKMRTTCYHVERVKIHTDYKNPWDLDGEAGPIGDVEISVLKRKLKIFCAERFANE